MALRASFSGWLNRSAGGPAMPLNWIVEKNPDSVPALIARGRYERALALLELQLEGDPTSVHLRQAVADLMLMTGKKDAAIEILVRLSEDFARAGFAAKAVAILKKIERFSTERTGDYKKLADELPRGEEPGGHDMERRPVGETGAVGQAAAPEDPDGPMPLARAVFEDFVGREGEWSLQQMLVDPKAGDPGVPRRLTTPLFEGFTPEELFPLLRGLRLVTYEPGDIIVSEGGPNEGLFIITSGRVKAFVRNAVGHFGKVRELTDGDFFGEIAFLASKPRTATVTAAARCEILILENSRLIEFCRIYPHAREVLERFAAERENSALEISVRKAAR
jgi:hypothetical protein